METNCRNIASQNTKVTEHNVSVTYIMALGCGILMPNVMRDSKILQYWLNMITRISPANLINRRTTNSENAAANAIVTSYVVSEYAFA